MRRSAYKGDAGLSGLLAKQGLSPAVSSIRDLLAGVAASALPETDDSWLALIGADLSPDLVAELRALKAEIAASGATRGAPGAAPAERVAALRAELARRGLDGFLVPRADEHQGEYVSSRAQRLAWLTGFSGSAGLAVVLRERAAIFVDGRYTLQVRGQVNVPLFEPQHLTDQPPDAWLALHLKQDQRLGYDPWLHTVDAIAKLKSAAERVGAVLAPVDGNPLDAVWRDQPPPPLGPVVPHALDFAGVEAAEKRRAVGEAVKKAGADAVVLTLPDSIAWALNVRGRDVPRTPLPLSFAVVDSEGQVDLFIDPRKLTPAARDRLGNAVSVRPPGEFAAGLSERAKERVLVDPSTAPAWVFDRLSEAGATIVRGPDPCQLAKACKNSVELDGTRRAHRRDGASVTRFLAWLAERAPQGGLSEIEASDRLAALRGANEHFRDLSFDTISGAGPNGAIVHYRAEPKSQGKLAPGQLYLVDSGAQYLDGTTDITRTIAVGEVGPEPKDRFTRVLKGHIALATARFPQGTTGSQLDALARRPLWEAGLDFDHGTGHGVGSYLSVHEGPQRISKLPNTQALKPGMIVSNEPGYYKTGAYGIRVENLVIVVELPKENGAERDMLGFETLTLAPIDRNLVEPSLMTEGELDWLNAYHARVRETITPLVDHETALWLAAATAPVR
ncbi:MAG: aminopeptidase P family protein [Proteobacteria bacterium]|nr:aminopeptidase P family protein [Pseudomonadota bacterium]